MSIYLATTSEIQETEEGVSIRLPVPCQKTILIKIDGLDQVRLIQETHEEGRDVMLHYYTYGTFILFRFCYPAHSGAR